MELSLSVRNSLGTLASPWTLALIFTVAQIGCMEIGWAGGPWGLWWMGRGMPSEREREREKLCKATLLVREGA